MFNLTPTTLARVEPLITVNEAHCLVMDGKRSRMALVWENDDGDIRIDAPASASGKTLADAERGLRIFTKLIEALREGDLSAYVSSSGPFIGRVPPEYWCTIEPHSAGAHFIEGKQILLAEDAVVSWGRHAVLILDGENKPTDRELAKQELAAWAGMRVREGVSSRSVDRKLIQQTWLGCRSAPPTVQQAKGAVADARGNPGPGRPKANDHS